MKLARIAVGVCFLGMGVVAACTTSNDEEALLPDAGVPETGAPDAPHLLDAGPSCENTCSPDGRSVVCGDSGIIETCSADKSCVNGQCMTVCEEAEATHGHLGCDYYVPAPDSFILAQGSCFAAFVVNPGTTPVTVTVERNGVSFDASKFGYTLSGSGPSLQYLPLTDGILSPGQGAVLFLSVTTPTPESSPLAICPEGTNTATTDDPAVHGVGFGSAFHIQSSAPISAYDIFPYGGGPSLIAGATLLLPTSTWDTNYMGITPSVAIDSMGFPAVPWIVLVAKEDNTQVQIAPTSDLIISGPGLNPVLEGQVGTFTLGKGQILQFEQEEELAGSPILANKAIGMWSGHTAALIPADQIFADAAHQQIPPVRALGHEYVAVSHRDRFDDKPETTPWRIVGTVDGTTLTYAPAAPKDAPTTLKSGQVVEFSSSAPFTIKSQDDKHPFYMAGYMTGCAVYAGVDEDGNPVDCRGDPEFVNVVPAQQYLDGYTFLTDPTYPETNLVIVRTKGDKGFADVNLDCAGVLTNWTPVGDFEWTRVDLNRHNFVAQGACNTGVHKITSTQPFGITVWGWGSAETDPSTEAVSYAYPGGMYVKPITDVVVTPIPK